MPRGARWGPDYVRAPNCLFRELNRGVDWIFSNHAAEVQALLRRSSVGGELSRLFPPFALVHEIKQDGPQEEEDQDGGDAPARGELTDLSQLPGGGRFRHEHPAHGQADHSHEGRTDNGREFPEHVVETVEFRRLLFGDQPGIIGAAQGLNAALDDPMKMAMT